MLTFTNAQEKLTKLKRRGKMLTLLIFNFPNQIRIQGEVVETLFKALAGLCQISERDIRPHILNTACCLLEPNGRLAQPYRHGVHVLVEWQEKRDDLTVIAGIAFAIQAFLDAHGFGDYSDILFLSTQAHFHHGELVLATPQA